MNQRNTKTGQKSIAAVEDRQLQAVENFAGVLTKASSVYMEAIGTGDILASVRAASAMQAVREAFTPEVLKEVLPLMNTPLGFLTDRDPKNAGRRQVAPYSNDVVKDALIEAGLRGLQYVGNQINIIGSRLYITKNGWEFLIKKNVEGLASFQHNLEPPSVKRDQAGNIVGAYVKCSANWVHKGKPGLIETTIAVKADSYTGVDGMVGKAESKLFKRIYQALTGILLTDGSDAEIIESEPSNERPGEHEQPATEKDGSKPVEKPVHAAPQTQGEVGHDHGRTTQSKKDPGLGI